MRDVHFYVKKAMERSGAKSERQICLMMGMADNTITNYRKRNVLPNEETMMKLAQIAGIDVFIALLDLNIWRSEGQAQAAYKNILKKISVGIVAVYLTLSAAQAQASPSGRFYENGCLLTSTSDGRYIITSGYVIPCVIC